MKKGIQSQCWSSLEGPARYVRVTTGIYTCSKLLYRDRLFIKAFKSPLGPVALAKLCDPVPPSAPGYPYSRCPLWEHNQGLPPKPGKPPQSFTSAQHVQREGAMQDPIYTHTQCPDPSPSLWPHPVSPPSNRQWLGPPLPCAVPVAF